MAPYTEAQLDRIAETLRRLGEPATALRLLACCWCVRPLLGPHDAEAVDRRLPRLCPRCHDR